MLANYKQVLKVMKYTQPSATLALNEISDKEDLQAARKYFQGTFEERKTGENKTAMHMTPAILSCKYGVNKDVDLNCPYFVRAFTTDGICYTFNAEPFWTIYHKRPWSETFFEEISATDFTTTEHQSVKYPGFNGPGFGLTLLINTFAASVVLSHRGEKQLRPVVIHNPSDIADFSGDVLKVVGGLHYTVQVTPHILHMDSEMLGKDQAVRKCFSHESDSDTLNIFANHRYANCLFECRLKHSLQKCGCVPWNYPSIN